MNVRDTHPTICMIARPVASAGKVEAKPTRRRAVLYTIIITAFGVPVTELFRKPRTKQTGLGRPRVRGKTGGKRTE
jgi:hypothetical protein